MPVSDELAQKTATAQENAPKKGRKEKRKGWDKDEGKNKRGKRRAIDSEEEEAEDSGAGGEDDKSGWGDGSEVERDDEEEVDELESSTCAMPVPSNEPGDDERGALPFSAKSSTKYQRILAIGQAGRPTYVARPTSRKSSSAVNEETGSEDAHDRWPVCPKPKPTYRGATNGLLNPKDSPQPRSCRLPTKAPQLMSSPPTSSLLPTSSPPPTSSPLLMSSLSRHPWMWTHRPGRPPVTPLVPHLPSSLLPLPHCIPLAPRSTRRCWIFSTQRSREGCGSQR
jgi:hypothetical protein